MPRSSRGLFRGLPRVVAILSSVSFTVALGYGIVAPGIPAFAKHFDVSTAAAASVISAFAAMRIVGALPAGRLVDRFGEHRTMAAGISVVAVSSLLAGFSGSFAQLIVLRGIGGLGSAMFSVSAQTLLLRSVPAELRGRASGLYTGGFLLGGISGPAIGGVLTAWSQRAPFFIYGIMLLVPAGIAAIALHDSPAAAGTAKTRAARPLAEIASALRSRAYRAAAAANLADGFAVMGVRSAIVPLFVRYVLHKSATWTGIGFLVVAALNAATLLPGGRAADTIGRRPVIVTGCLMSAASMVMLAVLPGTWGFLLAMAILGLGSGLLDVAPSAMIGDLMAGQRDQADKLPAGGKRPSRKGAGRKGKIGKRGQRGRAAGSPQGGTVVASYQMAGDIGTVAGPVTVGFLVDSVSYNAAFVLAACVLGLAALQGLLAPETRDRGTADREVAVIPDVPGLPPTPAELDQAR
ncbi:MAG TPA: MFS transporter [Streptosporangiaceae bacterium]|nr:MFS transporter [Streptosporangiaceae bacterium]